MAFTAEHAATGDIHNVAQADPDNDYLCLDCGNGVAYVRQHVRATPTGGNTTVASHFRCGCNESGGGGGGGTHESRVHKRRKRDALQEAVNRFEAADFDTEAYVGKKRADALLTFDEPHEEYGKGLVIEYQHKNEDKDINATEQHFARREYTTVWLWEDQYTYESAVPDIDLFGGRVYTPWPDAVPQLEAWPGRGHDAEKRKQWANAYDRGLTDASVPATVIFDWVMPTPREHWRDNNDWTDAFRYADHYPEERHRTQCAVGTGTVSRVEANVVAHWCLPTPREYWRRRRWVAGFRQENQRTTADYRAQVAVGKHTHSSHRCVTMPPDVVDSIIYEYSDWLALFDPPTDQNQTSQVNPTAEVKIDIAPFIDRTTWKNWYRLGRGKAYDDREDIDPPRTVFDDVQCHNCEHFQYAENAPRVCPTCDTPYDWLWNVETDRIDKSAVPDDLKFPLNA